MTEPKKPEIDFAELGDRFVQLQKDFIAGWAILRDALKPIVEWCEENKDSINEYLKERDGEG